MALFGTDGIREIVGRGVFEKENLRKLGYAISLWLKGKAKGKKSCSNFVLTGRDTRHSGIYIERTITNVLLKSGFNVKKFGIIPTPVISYLTRIEKPLATIVITASHNPVQYNGIKILASTGLKLSSEEELQIEKIYNGIESEVGKFDTYKGRTLRSNLHTLIKNYYLKNIQKDLRCSSEGDTLTIIVDCANGATYKLATAAFKMANITNVEFINNAPNGKNINVNAGVTNIEYTIGKLKKSGIRFDFLLSYDGDGDRVLVVDKKYTVYDGDYLLAIFTYFYKVLQRKRFKGVVGTIMSNAALEEFCRKLGLKLFRTAVGDRNVAIEMRKNKVPLGGESSGHIINTYLGSFGDGILNSILFLKIYTAYPDILQKVSQIYKPYKNCLVNVPVKEKIPIERLPNFVKEISKYNNKSLGEVRVVARYSGTENVFRIYVENPAAKKCREIALSLKKLFIEEYSKNA